MATPHRFEPSRMPTHPPCCSRHPERQASQNSSLTPRQRWLSVLIPRGNWDSMTTISPPLPCPSSTGSGYLPSWHVCGSARRSSCWSALIRMPYSTRSSVIGALGCLRCLRCLPHWWNANGHVGGMSALCRFACHQAMFVHLGYRSSSPPCLGPRCAVSGVRRRRLALSLTDWSRDR